MENRLLKKMFEHERWEALLEKSTLKGINKAEIRQYCKPEVRAELYKMIRDEQLEFQPAHEAKIPKDEPGEFRIVYVGETCERILCSLINDCLFELFPEMIHPSCKSYQKGLSCGKTVQELSKAISKRQLHEDPSAVEKGRKMYSFDKFDIDRGWIKNPEIIAETKVTGKLLDMYDDKYHIVGGKYDFHHYFDTVNKEPIMDLFAKVEQKLGFEYGTEPVMNLLRKTWNNDWMFDIDGNLIQKWSGIRQGNAIGSWLADAVLYELDEYMSNKYEYYVRYSDDLIVLHDSVDEITSDINRIVTNYGVSLNPKKVETLYDNRWFKFLGYSICGNKISISKGRLKTFQKEIMSRTIKQRNISPQRALNSVHRYLYKGNGEYAWAHQILGVVNVESDIDLMNGYILDCLRAVSTGKKKLGGLGYVPTQTEGVINRGKGKNVRMNKIKVPVVEGFCSLGMMQNALITNKNAYKTLIAQM